MTKASDNEFPSVLFDEQAGNPSTPASGFWRAYFKSDGMYVIDDAGAVTGPFGAAGSPAFHGVVAYHNTTEAINNTVFSLNSEDIDTDGYHSTSSNTSRLTVPSGLTGYYYVTGHQYTGAGTERAVSIRKTISATPSLVRGSYAASQFGGTTSAIVHLPTAGDYVELFTTENATFGHATNPERMNSLQMFLIGT